MWLGSSPPSQEPRTTLWLPALPHQAELLVLFQTSPASSDLRAPCWALRWLFRLERSSLSSLCIFLSFVPQLKRAFPEKRSLVTQMEIASQRFTSPDFILCLGLIAVWIFPCLSLTTEYMLHGIETLFKFVILNLYEKRIWERMHICIWITESLLYAWNQHSFVNQLYSNKIF